MNRSVLTYILIIGIAGTAGTTTGIIGKSIFGQEVIDYTGFNPEEFRADGAALLQQYNQQHYIFEGDSHLRCHLFQGIFQ